MILIVSILDLKDRNEFENGVKKRKQVLSKDFIFESLVLALENGYDTKFKKIDLMLN